MVKVGQTTTYLGISYIVREVSVGTITLEKISKTDYSNPLLVGVGTDRYFVMFPNEKPKDNMTFSLVTHHSHTETKYNLDTKTGINNSRNLPNFRQGSSLYNFLEKYSYDLSKLSIAGATREFEKDIIQHPDYLYFLCSYVNKELAYFRIDDASTIDKIKDKETAIVEYSHDLLEFYLYCYDAMDLPIKEEIFQFARLLPSKDTACYFYAFHSWDIACKGYDYNKDLNALVWGRKDAKKLFNRLYHSL